MKRTIFVCATILFALILTAGAFVPSKESTAKASAPQKGKQITTQVDLKFESAKDFDNFAAGRPPKPGEPIKGVGVIIQRRPGGSASMRKTDKDGNVTFVGLAPGNYSLTVQQLDSEALRQNHLFPKDNYEVEVTGAGLVGGTMNRSWDPTEKKFYREPPSATARTSVTHDTDSIDFEIKGTASTLRIIIKSVGGTASRN